MEESEKKGLNIFNKKYIFIFLAIIGFIILFIIPSILATYGGTSGGNPYSNPPTLPKQPTSADVYTNNLTIITTSVTGENYCVQNPWGNKPANPVDCCYLDTTKTFTQQAGKPVQYGYLLRCNPVDQTHTSMQSCNSNSIGVWNWGSGKACSGNQVCVDKDPNDPLTWGQCVACTPSCVGKCDGSDDGCYGKCLTCPTGYTCSSGKCVPKCTDTCTSLGLCGMAFICGVVTNCGDCKCSWGEICKKGDQCHWDSKCQKDGTCPEPKPKPDNYPCIASSKKPGVCKSGTCVEIPCTIGVTPPGTVCRPARSTCDIPEYFDANCNCPIDKSWPDGMGCTIPPDIRGFCFRGDCIPLKCFETLEGTCGTSAPNILSCCTKETYCCGGQVCCKIGPPPYTKENPLEKCGYTSKTGNFCSPQACPDGGNLCPPDGGSNWNSCCKKGETCHVESYFLGVFTAAFCLEDKCYGDEDVCGSRVVDGKTVYNCCAKGQCEDAAKMICKQKPCASKTQFECKGYDTVTHKLLGVCCRYNLDICGTLPRGAPVCIPFVIKKSNPLSTNTNSIYMVRDDNFTLNGVAYVVTPHITLNENETVTLNFSYYSDIGNSSIGLYRFEDEDFILSLCNSTNIINSISKNIGSNGDAINYNDEMKINVPAGALNYTENFSITKYNLNDCNIPQNSNNEPFYLSNVIDFVSPTLYDQENISNNSFIINISIYPNSPLNSLIFNWNGFNYTMYDNSMALMDNFDNNAVLGENSTFIVDDSLNSNNMTCSGASCPTFNNNGRYNGDFNFNGNQYFTALKNNTVTGNKPFTLMAWVNPNSYTDTYHSAVSMGSQGVYTCAYIGVVNAATAGTPNSLGGGLSFYNIGTGVNTPGWHHLAETFDGTNLYFYIDGKLNASIYAGGTNLGTGNPMVGSLCGYAGDNWNGGIDEPRIWNRALSSQEIYEQYVSNLNKVDLFKWNFISNQTLNSSTNTFQAFAIDDSGNISSTDLRTVYYNQGLNTLSPWQSLINFIKKLFEIK